MINYLKSTYKIVCFNFWSIALLLYRPSYFDDKLGLADLQQVCMASVKASQQGLVQIKQAMASKEWKWNSERPLLEASKILEPEKQWDEPGSYAYGCSQKSWKRFLQRIPIRPKPFNAFCQILGIDPEEIAQSDLKEDWREAPDVASFHGRQQELEILEQWIVQDKQRLINIVGFAGMGKTDLSLQFARKVRGDFEYLIWRRLLNAPPINTLLTELIEFVSDGRETELATTTDGLITQLLQYLDRRHCLLILDNVESILQSEKGDEGYGDFFRRIGTSKHQSCLLLTSRVKPRDIELMEGVHPVRTLELNGLDTAAGRAIFQDIARTNNASFQGEEEDWSRLVLFYSGNPLALEVTARHILRQYDGNIAEFLQHDLRVFGTIRELLDWHFIRLTPAQKNILYWLALNREAVSITELGEDLVLAKDRKYLPETLDALERQIPIEKNANRVTLQPVLIEYLSEKIIAEVCQELESGRLQILNSHALIKASAKDYVKDSQIRLILQPIIDRLNEIGLELSNSLENRLSRLLKNLNRQISGYTAGNLINLMRYGGIDLKGYDFSGLIIWQADLQDLNLQQVNFAGCKFANSSLTQDFGGVHAIAFSPKQDVFAVGDSIGSIRLFCLEDRQPYLYLEGHGKNLSIVTDLAFSPDGKLLASSSIDCTVKVWDTNTGECLQIFTNEQQWIWAVAFSPDSKIVAIGGEDSTIILWNIYTDERRILPGHHSWVWSLAFHPHQNILASASYDLSIRLWDIDTGECLNVLTGHQHILMGIDFHPSGEILASSSYDYTVKLWEVKTGKCLKTLEGHTKEVPCVAFNNNGKILVSGSSDCTIKLWEIQTGECLRTLRGHIQGVTTVDFASNGNIIATGDNNQVLKLWDVDEAKCLKTWQGYTNFMLTTAISPNGRLIASGSSDRTVRIWDIESRQLISTGTHNSWVWMVDFSPDGQTLASCSEDETIKLWDVNTGRCRKTLRNHAKIWTVKFSTDGKLLANGNQDGTICFWDSSTGDNLRCIQAHSLWIWAIAFSPNGRYLASGSADTDIKIWNVETGKCDLNLDRSLNKVMSIAFHPNGQMLASGDGKLIELWDIRTGESIQTFPGHTDTVLDLVFDLERNTLISSSIDSTIKIWSIDTGRCIQVLSGHETAVRAIDLVPDKQTLVSSSTDGTIRLWNLETGQTRKLLRPQKPYEEMNIADVKGLTAAQRKTLIALGARS